MLFSSSQSFSISFLQVSLFCIFSLHGQQPTQIVPAVMQGGCSICGTTSCTNCPKLSIVQRSKNEQEVSGCRACNDQGEFCSDTTLTQFRDSRSARATCRGKAPCGMRGVPPYTVFIPRSQGTNTARELAGWEEFIHQFAVGDYYLTTGHVLGYSHSFRPERIARELFGESVLRFAGSQVPDRGPCELLADNFGLSDRLRGVVTIEPVIENVIFDNQFFMGLDPLLCGLYMRIHLPIVFTRWNLNLSQKIEREACPDFPAGYMADASVASSCDIIKALGGQNTFGDMQTPWKFGRIKAGAQTKTGLADIDLIVGYDFNQTDTSHVGIYGQAVLPTGNKLDAKTLFDPLVGNAHHFELGFGVSGHIILLESDAHNNLAFYLEGNLVHMFKNTQMRSFDFCRNGPLSRYMLLKELAEQDGQFTYAGSLINGINFATRSVSVSIPAKGDISAKLAVRTTHIMVDVGYNFYGRTQEKVHFQDCADERTYAIKGSEGVAGLEYTTVGMQFGSFVEDVPLNTSQSQATIRTPALADNPQLALASNPSNIVVNAFSRQEGSIEGSDVQKAFISVPPRVLTVHDLHKASGISPSQVTHKVFGYIGYNMFEFDWCANPYLGIGGEVEFDALTCDERSSLNQWSVWLKGGFEF